MKNELRKASDMIVRSFGLEWEPRSRQVLFTTLPQGLSVDEYVRKVSSVERNTRTFGGESAGSTVTVLPIACQSAGP